MQKTNIWSSQYLLLQKITIALFILGLATQSATAQDVNMNNTLHDTKKFYFGISLGFNTSQYKITHDKWFIDYDSVTEVTPLWKPGLQLGIMGNMRLNSFVDIRTIPSFVLREKSVRFRLKDRNNPTQDVIQTSTFESILFHWPFEAKFKSDRQTNFRFYAILGGKIDYDFNSSVRKRRTSDLLHVKPWDIGANAGLGFEFYFPNFILAPEIKFSQGLINILDKAESDLQTAKAIERLNTRMIILSLHIQGKMRLLFMIVIILFSACQNNDSTKRKSKIKYALNKSGIGSNYPLSDFFVREGEKGIDGIYVDTTNKGLIVSFSVLYHTGDNIHGEFERIFNESNEGYHCDSIKLFYSIFHSGNSQHNKKVVANLYYRFTDVLSDKNSKFIAVDKSLIKD